MFMVTDSDVVQMTAVSEKKITVIHFKYFVSVLWSILCPFLKIWLGGDETGRSTIEGWGEMMGIK